MADITVPIGGKSDFKLLFKDQGSGIYAPAVSLIGGGGGGSTTLAALTDRVPFVNPNAGLPAIQVQAAVAQAAELWDFLDPGGVARVTVGSLTTLADSTLILGSVPSQTGPVLNVQNSGGTTVLQIEPSGRISTPAVTDLSIRAGTGGDVLIGSGSVNVIDVQGSQILLLQAVRASASNAIGLVVRGATGQTSDLQTWNEGTTNVVLVGINAVGGLRLAGSDTNTKLLVAPFGTATVAANDALIQCNADACTALIVKRFSATQSANLTEWHDETGALMSGVGPNGRFGIGTAPVSTQRLTVATSTTTHKGIVVKMVAAATGSAQEWQDSGGVARVTIGSLTATADATLVLRMITSQSGNPFEIRDAATNALLTSFGITGALVLANGVTLSNAASPGQRALIQPTATTTIGAVIRTAASQTASAQEWQDSGSVARVIVGDLTQTASPTLKLLPISSQTGSLILGRNSTDASDIFVVTAGGRVSAGGTPLSSVMISALSTAASIAPLVCKTAASQTNSCAEFQDSGGTARVTIGSLTAVGDATLKLRLITSQTGQAFVIRNAADSADILGIDVNGLVNAGGGGFTSSGNVTGAGIKSTTVTAGVNFFGNVIVAGCLLTLGTGAAGNVGLVIKGVGSQTGDLQRWQDSANNILGFVTASGAAAFKPRDAATNTIATGLTMGHNSSGTPAAAYGTQAQFVLQSSTTADQIVGELSYEWVVATDASRTARSKWTVYDTAVREAVRVEASGSAAMIGFLGSTAVVRQAGASAAGIAAITDASAKAAITALQAALAAYGLVTSPA